MSLLATCLKLLKYRCLGQQTCKKRCKNNGCKQYQTVASTIAVWLAEVQKVAFYSLRVSHSHSNLVGFNFTPCAPILVITKTVFQGPQKILQLSQTGAA